MKQTLPRSAPRSVPRIALLIGAVLVWPLLALTACNGDSDGSPTATGTPEETRKTSPGGAGGNQTLADLLDAYFAGVDGKITYRTTSENFGEHPNLIWTEYRLGDETRIDWRNVVDNPADDPMITTIAIISRDGSYICTTSPGLESCNVKTQEEAQTLVFWRPNVDEAPEAIAEGIDGMTVSGPAERELAGVRASCFDIQVPSQIGQTRAGTESIELCFSEQGGLLVMNRTVDFEDEALPTARLEVTAQEVGQAEPSDFEPTAPPLS
jgi:hypothetical protein